MPVSVNPVVAAPEMMAVAMARLLQDGNVVFNGVGSILPLLAIEVARRTHAPDLVFLNIGGGVDARPERLPFSSTDPTLLTATAGIIDQVEFYQLVMRGGVDVMYMGAVQIDPVGRTNSSVIGAIDRPKVRLPGGGGAAVVLPMARRVILWRTRHNRRSFVEKLDFVTAVGNVERVVTPLCVMALRGRLVVESLHPTVTPENVRDNTGFAIEIPPDCPVTPPPTSEERAAIQAFDPNNYRVLDFR
jgi:glutaconate CoA-transferase, subunit B